MKKVALVLVILAGFAAGCHEQRKDGPAPDYDGARAHAGDAHKDLDKEAGSY